jgi:N-acetylneuraminate synthase
MRVYVIAEGGINWQRDMQIAKRLIDAARFAGCDAIKWQKREPELCVPRDQWDTPKQTPWGETMPYLEYRKRMEFTASEYAELIEHARWAGVEMLASVFDEPSVRFVEAHEPPFFKIPSAKLTDTPLLEAVRAACIRTGATPILSTGMSTLAQIDLAVSTLEAPSHRLWLAHCCSAYPAPYESLNLRAIRTLAARYPRALVGYSGHEVGLYTTVAAVALGAQWIERHITLDRALPGSDHAASVEPQGMYQLVKAIRSVEVALGDGEKRVEQCEEGPMRKLRGSA